MAESSDFSDDIRRETDEKSDNCSVTDENKAVAKTKTPHSVESDETLTGVQFHSAIIEDRLRDACKQGDMPVLRGMLDDLSPAETVSLLQRCSSCTGTPLFDAIISQQQEVVDALLDYEIDLELECDVSIFYPIFFRDRCSALCLACACGDVGITGLLIAAGASINHSSLHSSPLIYASEFNNVELMSLLLEHGADIHMVPKGLKTETAVLPLYQACLFGHKDVAELLLQDANVDLGLEKRACLLGLLGAQCINKQQDFDTGVLLWKRALSELESSLTACGPSAATDNRDLSHMLQRLYMREAQEPLAFSHSMDKMDATASHPRRHTNTVFSGMKLCCTVDELDKLAGDENALRMQGLLVLESILGPSHPETTSQVSQAAREALENEDLSTACRLFLYIIESNENRNQTSTATEYTSQLADLLLNVFCNMPDKLAQIPDLPDLLLAAIELLKDGMCKVYEQCHVGGGQGHGHHDDHGFLETQVKQQSKVRLHCEMVETLMAFLSILVEQPITEAHWKALSVVVRQLLQLSANIPDLKFNIECEMLKIAVYGGQSTLSTLYFFQEELYPNTKILEFLLVCGANVNVLDCRRDSPLHFALDCQKPSGDIVKMLLSHGAHIDTCNRYGQSPYQYLMRQPQLAIHPFPYLTLKCLAARAIMNFHIPYGDQIPKVLEVFVPLHGCSRNCVRNRKPGTKNSASLDDVHLSCTLSCTL